MLLPAATSMWLAAGVWMRRPRTGPSSLPILNGQNIAGYLFMFMGQVLKPALLLILRITAEKSGVL